MYITNLTTDTNIPETCPQWAKVTSATRHSKSFSSDVNSPTSRIYVLTPFAAHILIIFTVASFP